MKILILTIIIGLWIYLGNSKDIYHGEYHDSEL